ncbi:MAG: DNA methyltransferase [Christensenellaceae bacterium]
MEKQTKSKERVRDYGEVFTNEREVKAMCDLVKDETERIDSRFLEPACGDGNFLAEILKRKLAVVKAKYKKSPLDYERNAVLAATSIYGVDIMADNVEACRNRMFEIWNKEYTAVCKKDANDQTRDAVKFIFQKNIVCGNALTLKKVDKDGNELREPIVFSEWAFITGSNLQRKDYTFDELLNSDKKQLTIKEDDEGTFLRQYITHYRRVQDYE